MAWLPLILACLVAILIPLGRLLTTTRSKAVTAQPRDLNKSLFGEKLADLDIQLEQGDISRQEYEALLVEFQRQLLIDTPDQTVEATSGRGRQNRWLLPVVILGIPLMAFLLYDYLGASSELTLRKQLETRSILLGNPEATEEKLQEVTQALSVNLKDLMTDKPDDPLYPVLLARLDLEQGNFNGAVDYYQKAVSLVPNDGELQAEYAQALFFAQGNQVTPRVLALAELAVSLSPSNDMALGLLGIHAFHTENYAQAIEYWQQALSALPPMAASRESLVAGIATARKKLGVDPEAVASPRSLTLNVSLGDGVKAGPDATVFVYARAWQGSPMPLSIRKLRVADLPANVVLDETMAMNSAQTLASVPQVELVARLSFSGTAMPASGDYLGTFGPVDTTSSGDNGIETYPIVIDRQIP